MSIFPEELIQIESLEVNWDGYGSTPFPQEQIDRAYSLYLYILNYMDKNRVGKHLTPFIVPCSGRDGDIRFEWTGMRFSERQLEVYIPRKKSEKLGYLKSVGKDDSHDEEGEVKVDNMGDLLGWLFEPLVTGCGEGKVIG